MSVLGWSAQGSARWRDDTELECTASYYPIPGPSVVRLMTVGQTQLERAIYEIQHRATAPQPDFTQHQLDDGRTVSTQERVIEEVRRTASHYMCGCDGSGEDR
jgi:hypothetical protein